jgi:hypothetical protein
MRKIWLATILILGVALSPLTAIAGELSVGAGVGAILHGNAGGDVRSKSGVVNSGILEYVSDRNIGVRCEVSWIEFPENSAGIVPPPTGYWWRQPEVPGREDISLSGGTLRMMWFADHGRWVRSMGAFSVGGYKVDQDEYSQMMILIGPGFGARVGGRRIAAGAELDFQLAVFENRNILMVPVKAYALIRLY